MATGNMNDWWTDGRPQGVRRPGQEADPAVRRLRPRPITPGQHVNGALTIGENIGDLGGLTIALKAYKIALENSESPVLDGLSGEQRLFIGWAQVWRSKYRDAELSRRLATDPHSPAEFRCNGIVRNIPEFYDAFKIKEGDKLYVAPEKRVKIW